MTYDVFGDLKDGGGVVELAAVVRRGKDGDEQAVVEEFVAFLGGLNIRMELGDKLEITDLMGADDQLQFEVLAEKFGCLDAEDAHRSAETLLVVLN